MSSVYGQQFAQVPPNALYINLLPVQSTIVDSNNNVVPWVVASGALSTAGACVFRDMGRNVYRPDPNVTTAVGGLSTVLRRVQLVTVGPAYSYYGTGNSSICGAGSDTDFFTGYIRLGGVGQGGGGTGVPSGLVRLN